MRFTLFPKVAEHLLFTKGFMTSKHTRHQSIKHCLPPQQLKLKQPVIKCHHYNKQDVSLTGSRSFQVAKWPTVWSVLSLGFLRFFTSEGVSCFKKIERQKQDDKLMSSVAAFPAENLFVEKLTNEEAYKGAAGFRYRSTYDLILTQNPWLSYRTCEVIKDAKVTQTTWKTSSNFRKVVRILFCPKRYSDHKREIYFWWWNKGMKNKKEKEE